MNNIADLEVYNNQMRLGMQDKIRWVDDIPDNIVNVIDFGCADGSLFVYLSELFPNRFTFYGIDNNQDMINAAPKEIEGKRVHYFHNIYELRKTCGKITDSIIVLNSVIHELFAYQSYDQAYEDIKDIFSYGANYITIRDMCLPIVRHGEHLSYSDWYALFDKYLTVEEKVQWLLFKDYNPPTTDTVIEFLMKYQYKENWDREGRERYFWNWTSLIEDIRTEVCDELNLGYDLEKFVRFGITPQQDIWREQFHINFSADTHAYCLFKLFK